MSSELSTEPRYAVEETDHVYSRQDGEEWLARVYRPQGEGPFPTVLNVHGGVWVRPGRDRNEELSRALAERGVLTMAIDIHVPPQAGFPASMRDVNVATRWLKAHAAEFGGSSRVGAIGTSSGGHQVQLLGIQPHNPLFADLPGEPDVDATVAYVVACWPIPDPVWRYQFVKQNGPDLYINGHESFWGPEGAAVEGSPQHLVDDDVEGLLFPPMLVVVRDQDPLHPQEMQDRFIDSYRRHGGDIDLAVLPADFPQVFERGPQGDQTLEAILPFVARHA